MRYPLRTALLLASSLHLDEQGDPSGNGTATAAPDPTLGTPQNPVTAPAERNALTDTFAQLRSQLSGDGKALVVDDGARPRDERGQFQSPTAVAAADELEGAGDPPADPPASDEPTAATAELEPPLDPAVEPQGDEPSDDELVVMLPPRRAGEAPVPFRATSLEEAEHLRRLNNGYERGEQTRAIRAQLEQREAELARFEALADADPAGLVLDHLRPEARLELARHLLAQQEVFDAIVPTIDTWSQDPAARRADSAELRAARAERRPAIERELARREGVQRVVNSVRSNVEALAEAVPGELREQFIADAIGDASRYIRANRVRDPFAPEQFADVVQQRLRLYGVDKTRALAALTGQAVPPSTAAAPRPKGPDAERLAREAQGRTRDGKQLVEDHNRRKATAAATPGPGVSPAVPRPAPPANQGIKERMAWVRQNGFGRRS
jgi:hypothetical protein